MKFVPKKFLQLQPIQFVMLCQGSLRKCTHIPLEVTKMILRDRIWDFWHIFMGFPRGNLKLHCRPAVCEQSEGTRSHRLHPHGLTCSLPQKTSSGSRLSMKQALHILILFCPLVSIWQHLLMLSVTKQVTLNSEQYKNRPQKGQRQHGYWVISQ